MSLLNRRPSTPQQSVAGTGYSLLDSQLSVDGDIATIGSLRIDGRLSGSILRADTVVLGVGATMVGNVNAREVIVGGALTGTITATDRVELQTTAIVNGDIRTQVVLVQEGGVINGRVEMQPPPGSSASASGTSAAALPGSRHS